MCWKRRDLFDSDQGGGKIASFFAFFQKVVVKFAGNENYFFHFFRVRDENIKDDFLERSFS